MAGALLRVAHSFGNSRRLLQIALASPVDMIEADVRLRGGRLWLGHDRRLPLLPIYVARQSLEPREWSLFRLGPVQVRFLPHPMPLEGLLESAGACQLLLDLKQSYRSESAAEYVGILAASLRRFGREALDCLCGDWIFLDAARRELPETRLYYSVGDSRAWQALVHRFEAGDQINGISLRSNLFDGSSAHLLQTRGVETLCWCVDDPAEAARVTTLGAGGIISNNLPMLARIGETAAPG